MAGATRPHPALEPHAPVQDTMFRALGVLRFVVLLNAVGLYLFRFETYDHPLAGWFVKTLPERLLLRVVGTLIEILAGWQTAQQLGGL